MFVLVDLKDERATAKCLLVLAELEVEIRGGRQTLHSVSSNRVLPIHYTSYLSGFIV